MFLCVSFSFELNYESYQFSPAFLAQFASFDMEQLETANNLFMASAWIKRRILSFLPVPAWRHFQSSLNIHNCPITPKEYVIVSYGHIITSYVGTYVQVPG